MFWAWLLLFGITIGFLSGLLGIGGGVVMIPGLIFLFGFTQAEAQGTSLAVMIPPIGIFAAMVYYQHGFIRFPVVGLIAVGFMLGAYLGAGIVPRLSPFYLRLPFGILLLYLGMNFVLSPSGNRASTALPAGVLTVLTAVLARFLKRKTAPRSSLPPPGDDLEYHI